MLVRRFLASFAAAFLLASPSIGAAQDTPPAGDPFAVELDDVFAEQAPEEEEAAALSPPDDPAVQQWLARARRGPETRGAAIAALARMGQWEEVDRLLSEAAEGERPQRELAAMGQQIEPAILVRIATHQDLSEAARQFAHRLAKAVASESEAPAALRAAIGQLDSASVDQRLAAQRTLLRGGRASVTALVEALVAETPPASRDRMLRVLLRLGEDGPRALKQLALYGDLPVQQRALEALVRLDAQAYLPELLTALYASDAGEALRGVAASAFARLADTLPQREEAIHFLHRDLQQQRRAAAGTENSAQTTTLWSVDEQQSGVQPRIVRAMPAAWRRAADAAARLRRIGNLPPEVAREALLAEIGYRVVIDPEWGDAEQTAQLSQTHGPAATGGELSAAIAQALRERDWPALVGLVRLVRPDTPAAERETLLHGNSPQPTPLTQATSAAEPRARYEAASAIARLDPQTPFPGATAVAQTFAEMRALSDRPMAIVVESRLEVIQRLETLLSDLGYRVAVVGSARALVDEVAAGGDLRLILSKTNLADLPPIELVDRVRRRDLGAEVPIVFYGEDSRWLGAERWKGLTVQIPTPRSIAGLAGVLEQIERERQLPPLSELDRRLYRDAVPEAPSFASRAIAERAR